jgi:general secretion pathway protein B
MSYILDALNKAENERQLGGVPTLDSQHQVYEEIKPRRFWPVAILIAIILNAVLIGYLIYSRSNPETDKDALTAVPSTNTNLSPPVQAEPVSTPQKIPQAFSKNNSAAAAKPELSATDIEAAQRAFDDFLKENALSEPKINQDQNVTNSVVVKNTAKTMVEERADFSDEQDLGMDVPASRQHRGNQIGVRGVTVISNNDSQDIPYLSDTSEDFQTSVPDLVIDVHVFSKTPTKRFILVNLEKYQEDDHIAKGLLLEEITEDGLILSYQNKKFKWPMLTE